MKDIQVNSSVLYDMLQIASFISTPFLLPCGLIFKYSKPSPNMVLPITVENNRICGGKNLVNAEEFTDMQINVGSYTAAVEAGSVSYRNTA